MSDQIEQLPPEAEMTDEQILAALSVEPQAVVNEGVKPVKWDKLTAGQQAIAVADQNNVTMTDEERAQLEEMESAELVKQFLKCGFGKREALDTTLARSIFSNMLMQKMDIPSMLFTAQYYNLVGTEKAIEYAEELKVSALDIADVERREAAKLQALKLELFARKLSSEMAKRAQGLAQQIVPKEPEKRGKNKAPDVMIQMNNCIVQSPTGGNAVPA